MKKRTNPFRALASSPQPVIEEAQEPKPTSDLTDAELEESLRQARKDLLDVRHEELRIREKARVTPEDGGQNQRLSLSSIFKKKGFK